MKKKMLFIYNPRSGKGLIRNSLFDIIDIFTKGGFEVIVHPTQESMDANRTAAEYAKQVDLVVCSGGDGTLDEVVDAIVKTRPELPVGYIPAGSTNDFGASLGISRDLTEAATDIVYGKEFLCDIGQFNDQSFVYIAAFGLFTDVAYETDQGKKNILGHAAYLIEAGKRLLTIPSYKVHIIADDTELTGRFVYGMITNSKSVGGIRNLPGPDVDLTDGVFEVRLVYPPATILELNEILAALFNPHLESKSVLSLKAKRLKITAQLPIAWTLDGEYGGEHTEVEIVNRQQLLHMIVNPDKAAEATE